MQLSLVNQQHSGHCANNNSLLPQSEGGTAFSKSVYGLPSGGKSSPGILSVHCLILAEQQSLNTRRVVMYNPLTKQYMPLEKQDSLPCNDKRPEHPRVKQKPLSLGQARAIWNQSIELEKNRSPFASMIPCPVDDVSADQPLVKPEQTIMAALMLGSQVFTGGLQMLSGSVTPSIGSDSGNASSLKIASQSDWITADSSLHTVTTGIPVTTPCSAEARSIKQPAQASTEVQPDSSVFSWLPGHRQLRQALTLLPMAFTQKPFSLISTLTLASLDSATVDAKAAVTPNPDNPANPAQTELPANTSTPISTLSPEPQGISVQDLQWLANNTLTDNEKQAVAQELRDLISSSGKSRRKRHHKVPDHVGNKELSKILKYLHRHGLPKTPEQQTRYDAFIQGLNLDHQGRAAEITLKATLGQTGLTVDEIKALFGEHQTLPESVGKMLAMHFPKTRLSQTKKHAEVADQCGILEAVSPILQLDGAIESLGHHIEHLLKADHMSDDEKKSFKRQVLKSFKDRFYGLSQSQMYALAFKEGFSSMGLAGGLWRSHIRDIQNGEIESSLSVKEIEGWETAIEAVEIFTGLIPGMASITALVDLVTAIQLGQDDICTWLRDGLFIGLGAAAFGEGGGIGQLPEEEVLEKAGEEEQGVPKQDPAADLPGVQSEVAENPVTRAVPDINLDRRYQQLKVRETRLLDRLNLLTELADLEEQGDSPLKAGIQKQLDQLARDGITGGYTKVTRQLSKISHAIGERMQQVTGWKPADHPTQVPPKVQAFVDQHMDKIREFLYEQGINEALHRAHRRMKGIKESHQLPIAVRNGERYVHLETGHRNGLYRLIPAEHGTEHTYRLRHSEHGYLHPEEFKEVDIGKDGKVEKVLVCCEENRAGGRRRWKIKFDRQHRLNYVEIEAKSGPHKGQKVKYALHKEANSELFSLREMETAKQVPGLYRKSNGRLEKVGLKGGAGDEEPLQGTSRGSRPKSQQERALDNLYLSSYRKFVGKNERELIDDLDFFEEEIGEKNADVEALNNRILSRYNKVLEKITQLVEAGEVSDTDFIMIEEGFSDQARNSAMRTNLEKLKEYAKKSGKNALEINRRENQLKDGKETGLKKRPSLNYSETLFEKTLRAILKSLSENERYVKPAIEECLKDEYPHLSRMQYKELLKRSLDYFSKSKSGFTEDEISLISEWQKNKARGSTQKRGSQLEDIEETDFKKRPSLNYSEKLFEKTLRAILKSLSENERHVKPAIHEYLKDEYPHLSRSQYKELLKRSLAYFSTSTSTSGFTEEEISLISEWQKNKGRGTKVKGIKSKRKSTPEVSQKKSIKLIGQHNTDGDKLSSLREYVNDSSALRNEMAVSQSTIDSYYKLNKYKEEILKKITRIENEMEGLGSEQVYRLENKRHRLVMDVLPKINGKMDVIIENFVGHVFQNNQNSELFEFVQSEIEKTTGHRETIIDNNHDSQGSDSINFQSLVSGVYDEEEVNSAIQDVNDRISISDSSIRHDCFESDIKSKLKELEAILEGLQRKR